MARVKETDPGPTRDWLISRVAELELRLAETEIVGSETGPEPPPRPERQTYEADNFENFDYYDADEIDAYLAALRVGPPQADTKDLLDRLIGIMNTLHKGDGPHCNCGVKETIALIRDWQDRMSAGVPPPAAETPRCTEVSMGSQIAESGRCALKAGHSGSHALVPPPAAETSGGKWFTKDQLDTMDANIRSMTEDYKVLQLERDALVGKLASLREERERILEMIRKELA